jgi:predicted dienelactone hydrolase
MARHAAHGSAALRAPTIVLKAILKFAFALLGFCFAIAGASSSDVGYRGIQIQDSVTAESFPVAVWYPTSAHSDVIELGPYTMRVARDAMPAEGQFGLVVISHGSGGGNLNHRDLAMALASSGYVRVWAPSPCGPVGPGRCRA